MLAADTVGPFGYPADFLLLFLLYASLLLHTWMFFRTGALRARPRARLLAGNLLVFASLLGTIGMTGEMYLRFLGMELDSFGLSLPSRRWFALHTRLNSIGCRDDEWTIEKPPGIRRIAFLGDSYCYGWGIENEKDRYTGLIQARFDALAPGRVQVMNVAKPGWSTTDQIKPVTDLIAHFHVDEIVLCYVLNDIEKVIPTTEDFDPTKPPQPRFINPETSCLLDYLYRTFVVPRADTVRGYHQWLASAYADEQAWRLHRRDLQAIVDVSRKSGVKLRAVLQPFLRVPEDFDRRSLHAAVREFFIANNVQVLDLLSLAEATPVASLTVNRRDAHPNEEAHALFAEAIWRAFYKPAAK